MTRFKAFGTHLVLSLAIFAIVLGILVLAWFPWPLFGLEGGWRGLRIVALVDVVLGPALTLLLFKPGKPGLKFDMTMVVLMQVAALAYGMWNLHESRPVLLVHADDHMQPLSRVRLAEIDSSGALLKQWESMTPQRVSVELPDDPVAFAELYHEVHGRPGGLHGLAKRYRPMRKHWPKMLQDAIRIEPYVANHDEWRQRFDAFLKDSERQVGELAFFPYIGTRQRLFLAMDRASAEIVGVLDVPYDPVLAKREVPRVERLALDAAAG